MLYLLKLRKERNMSLEDLSLNEMKKISHQIIESEEKKYNISIKVFPLTFIEYYNNYIFKKILV